MSQFFQRNNHNHNHNNNNNSRRSRNIFNNFNFNDFFRKDNWDLRNLNLNLNSQNPFRRRRPPRRSQPYSHSNPSTSNTRNNSRNSHHRGQNHGDNEDFNPLNMFGNFFSGFPPNQNNNTFNFGFNPHQNDPGHMRSHRNNNHHVHREHQREYRPSDTIKEHPTSKKEIDLLPVFYLTEMRANKLMYAGDEQSCAICLEDFEKIKNYKDKTKDKLICPLPCQHYFHEQCIKPWLMKQNTCPVCRFELPLDDPKKEMERQKRMVELFTFEGLKIMELGSQVESLFSVVCDAIENKSLKEKIKILKECNAKLFELMLRLDTFENFKTMRIHDKRRQLVKKIQAIQKVVDKKLSNITEMN